MKKNCSMIFVWTINPQDFPKSQNLSRETLLQSVWVGLWCWNVSQMENPRLLFIGSTQLMVKVSCWEVLKSIYEPPWQKKKEKKKRHFSNLWKSSFSHNFSHCRDKHEQRMTRFAPICIRNVKFINDVITKYTFLSSYSSQHCVFHLPYFFKEDSLWTFAGVDESIRNESWHGDLFSSTCVFDKNFLCSRVLLG